MRSLTLNGPSTISFSLAKIFRSSRPKEELENEIVGMLSPQLKRYGISWNVSSFKAGLNNPDLPDGLLVKLEEFLDVAQRLRWNLPESFINSLDNIIEDIESFSPAFLKSLKDSAAAKRISSSEIKKRLRL